MAFYEYQLILGVRLPLHPFVRDVLRCYKITLGQLIVNGWRVVLSSFALWAQAGNGELTAEEFLRMFRLKKAPSSEGWYYLCYWHRDNFVLGKPSSNYPGWRKRWFYASGNWESASSRGPGVTRFFCEGRHNLTLCSFLQLRF